MYSSRTDSAKPSRQTVSKHWTTSQGNTHVLTHINTCTVIKGQIQTSAILHSLRQRRGAVVSSPETNNVLSKQAKWFSMPSHVTALNIITYNRLDQYPVKIHHKRSDGTHCCHHVKPLLPSSKLTSTMAYSNTMSEAQGCSFSGIHLVNNRCQSTPLNTISFTFKIVFWTTILHYIPHLPFLEIHSSKQ